MNAEKLFSAFSGLNERYIYESMQVCARKKSGRLVRVLAAALSILLIVGGALAVVYFKGRPDAASLPEWYGSDILKLVSITYDDTTVSDLQNSIMCSAQTGTSGGMGLYSENIEIDGDIKASVQTITNARVIRIKDGSNVAGMDNCRAVFYDIQESVYIDAWSYITEHYDDPESFTVLEYDADTATLVYYRDFAAGASLYKAVLGSGNEPDIKDYPYGENGKSPDGRYITYTYAGKFTLFDTQTTNYTRLSGKFVSFSDDGRSITMCSDGEESTYILEDVLAGNDTSRFFVNVRRLPDFPAEYKYIITVRDTKSDIRESVSGAEASAYCVNERYLYTYLINDSFVCCYDMSTGERFEIPVSPAFTGQTELLSDSYLLKFTLGVNTDASRLLLMYEPQDTGNLRYSSFSPYLVPSAYTFSRANGYSSIADMGEYKSMSKCPVGMLVDEGKPSDEQRFSYREYGGKAYLYMKLERKNDGLLFVQDLSECNFERYYIRRDEKLILNIAELDSYIKTNYSDREDYRFSEPKEISNDIEAIRRVCPPPDGSCATFDFLLSHADEIDACTEKTVFLYTVQDTCLAVHSEVTDGIPALSFDDASVMTDENIVSLFFARSEDAIRALLDKYGGMLHRLALGILRLREDAEKCVSDTTLDVWNTVPPRKPVYIGAYSAVIARRRACDRIRADTAAKRGGGTYTQLIDELCECVGSGSPEQVIENARIESTINDFAGGLPYMTRVIFVRRYFWCESIADIAAALAITPNRTSVILSRTRSKLRAYLEHEGICIK